MTPRPLGRRSVVIAAALAGALAVSSCSSVQSDAARVDGTRITMNDFENDLKAFADIPETQISIVRNAVNGDTARGFLTTIIEVNLEHKELARRGEKPTDQELADAKNQVDQGLSGTKAKVPDHLKNLLVDLFATRAAFQRISAPSEADIKATYDKGVDASGLACVSHILVDTEQQANDVLAQLKTGTAFATVAKSTSKDTGSAQQGGVIAGQDGSPCIAIDTFSQQFDQDFVAGVRAAKVGEPTAPVKTQFGYHVILVRPFEEVKASVVPSLQGVAATTALTKLVQGADVTVNSSIGRWDPKQGAVLPLA